MRFYNTTGPIEPDRHYCVPPLQRVKLREIHTLVQRRRYFVLHAPRQTGKTSTLLALKQWLNGQGDCECIYANFEVGQAARENTEQAMRAMLGELASRAQAESSGFPHAAWPRILSEAGPFGALGEALTIWSRAAAKTAGAAHRRNRHVDRRYVAFRAASTPLALRPPPARVPAERCFVRGARCARLPHSLWLDERSRSWRQRLQRQGQVAAPWRLQLSRGSAAFCNSTRRRARSSPQKRSRRSGNKPKASRGW